MRRFLRALSLIEEVNSEAASGSPVSARDIFSITRLYIAVLSIAEKYVLLLYIEAAAAGIRGRQQSLPFSEPALYFYAASLLPRLKRPHRLASRKHPLTIKKFLQTEIPLIERFSLPVKKVYLGTMSLSLFEVADYKELLAALGKMLAQSGVPAVPKHFSLERGRPFRRW